MHMTRLRFGLATASVVVDGGASSHCLSFSFSFAASSSFSYLASRSASLIICASVLGGSAPSGTLLANLAGGLVDPRTGFETWSFESSTGKMSTTPVTVLRAGSL